MRPLSLNVALFETNNTGLFNFLSKIKADIICLQEITQKIDQEVDSRYLSKRHIDKATPDLKYSFFSPNWIIKDFHMKNFHKLKSFDFDFGGFLKSGNHIKSKFKILKKSNIFVQENKEIKITDWSTWPDKQSQAAQVVDLELGNNKKFRVLNYHGIWTKDKIGNKETLKAYKIIKALALKVNFFKVLDSNVSDHLPLILDFEI